MNDESLAEQGKKEQRQVGFQLLLDLDEVIGYDMLPAI
jgi:hypothetical protein